MKRLLIVIFILPTVLFAQKQIIIQGTYPDIYVNHTIVPKDNFYSIGRMYNIVPKEIEKLNNITMEQGLNLGQVIKISLTANNFTQNETVATDEALVPLYYTVKPKEGLYRISVDNNKISIATIKQWNKLTNEEVNAGQNLIVGFLKVKKALSTLVNGAVLTDIPVPPLKKTDTIVTQTDTKKDTITTHKDPQLEPKNDNVKVVEGKSDSIPVVHAKDFGGGVFKDMYQSKNEIKDNGEAGVFKSTSGWEDGKYYCLFNNAQPQTIVKITHSATGKSIYAKVMDMMPDIKQNKNLSILISNAAADWLGVSENKFSCSISYSK